MSLLGGIVGAIAGSVQQAEQNDFNAHQAAINRQFQADQAQLAYERTLSADSTKYQRQVADLQAAGLNPMLAVSQSAGSVQASSASGSQATAANVGNIGALLMQGEQLRVQKMLAEAQVRNIDADTEKTKVETEGQALSNSLFRDTADIRKVLLGDEHERNLWEKEIGLRGVKVKEDNQRLLVENASHYNSMLDAQSNLISEQSVSESVKRQMYSANARESRMNAGYKAAMLELDKQYRSAATEVERNQAELLSIEARFKNGVYTPEYIESICKDAGAMADYHAIMTQYYKGDYSAASKSLQKVFREGERLGKSYGLANLSHSISPSSIIPGLN